MKGIHNISSFKKYFLKTFKLPRQVAKDCPSIRPSHLVTEITTVNQVIIFEIIYRTKCTIIRTYLVQVNKILMLPRNILKAIEIPFFTRLK